MRISDWSSDVCSSDLRRLREGRPARPRAGRAQDADQLPEPREDPEAPRAAPGPARPAEARRPLGAGVPGRAGGAADGLQPDLRSEEHTSELQSLMRISYAVFCLKKKRNK